MTAKKYLSRPWELHIKIERLKGQVAEKRSKLGISAQTYREHIKAFRSGGGTLPDKLSDIFELEKQLADLIAEQCKISNEITRKLRVIDDFQCQRLLEARHVWLLSWGEVAKEVGISRDHARGYLHKKSLKIFEKTIDLTHEVCYN